MSGYRCRCRAYHSRDIEAALGAHPAQRESLATEAISDRAGRPLQCLQSILASGNTTPAGSGVDPIKNGYPRPAGVAHPQQRVMVDRPGLQMLRDFEARLLFRLIGRRTLETFRRHLWDVTAPSRLASDRQPPRSPPRSPASSVRRECPACRWLSSSLAQPASTR